MQSLLEERKLMRSKDRWRIGKMPVGPDRYIYTVYENEIGVGQTLCYHSKEMAMIVAAMLNHEAQALNTEKDGGE